MWLLWLISLFTISSAISVNKQCRDLLSCSIKQQCVNLPWLIDQMSDQEIKLEMYNDVDKATDYGCIFSTGCQDECDRCPLCKNSKLQVVDVLSGTPVQKEADCRELRECASECVAESSDDINRINHCLRHTCAYHCFDGTCPKCSAFVTRIFNQMCVSGDFRSIVKGFQGQCYEMFREIVHAKFRSQFDAAGTEPAIGRGRGEQ